MKFFDSLIKSAPKAAPDNSAINEEFFTKLGRGMGLFSKYDTDPRAIIKETDIAKRGKMFKAARNTGSMPFATFEDFEKAYTQQEALNVERKALKDALGDKTADQITKEDWEKYHSGIIDRDTANRIAHEESVLKRKLTDDQKKQMREISEKLNPYDTNKSATDLFQSAANEIDKLAESLPEIKQPTGIAKFHNMFLDENAEFSTRRAGMLAAGIYGASNIIGSGSLGIPFISTASWNR